MSAELIVFGIQATLRAAQAGASLYGEHARDRPVFLPALEFPAGGPQLQLIEFLRAHPDLAASEASFRAVWSARQRIIIDDAPALIDAAYAVMLKLRARLQLAEQARDGALDTERQAELLAAGRMVEQWRRDRQPPSAAARLAITLVDVGLEYVAADPSIFGISSRGEQLVVAFARSLDAVIPADTDAFDGRVDFADRVLGVLLRTGLGTLSANPGLVIRDPDAAVMVTAVLGPVVDALPADITDQMRYRDLVDALIGPSAEAAFQLLARDTGGFLGADFAQEKPLGAVTAALFTEIAETAADGSVLAVFTRDGTTELYQAVLAVAAQRPGLFVGSAEAEQTLLRDLLRGAAETLRAQPRIDGPVAASLAAMVIRTVGKHAGTLLAIDADKPWERVALDVIEQLVRGLGDSTAAGAFRRFSDAELLEFMRVVIESAARTPGILDVDRTELQAVVAGVAGVMAGDETLLLSPDDWLRIAAVAAREAAGNPGRLFGLASDDPRASLGSAVMDAVLNAAADAWADAGGRAPGTRLFGATLVDALALVLEGLSGNVEGVLREPAAIDEFFRLLLAQAALHPDRFGSRSMLRAIDALIGDVLATGAVPDQARLMEALA